MKQIFPHISSYLGCCWEMPSTPGAGSGGGGGDRGGRAEGAGFLPSVNAYQKHPVQNCLEMRILVGSV